MLGTVECFLSELLHDDKKNTLTGMENQKEIFLLRITVSHIQVISH